MGVTVETAVKGAYHDRFLIDQATKSLENARRSDGMLELPPASPALLFSAAFANS
jgi:hypothetical protein